MELAAHQARLGCYKPDVVAIANPARFREREQALVDGFRVRWPSGAFGRHTCLCRRLSSNRLCVLGFGCRVAQCGEQPEPMFESCLHLCRIRCPQAVLFREPLAHPFAASSGERKRLISAIKRSRSLADACSPRIASGCFGAGLLFRADVGRSGRDVGCWSCPGPLCNWPPPFAFGFSVRSRLSPPEGQAHRRRLPRQSRRARTAHTVARRSGSPHATRRGRIGNRAYRPIGRDPLAGGVGQDRCEIDHPQPDRSTSSEPWRSHAGRGLCAQSQARSRVAHSERSARAPAGSPPGWSPPGIFRD